MKVPVVYQMAAEYLRKPILYWAFLQITFSMVTMKARSSLLSSIKGFYLFKKGAINKYDTI